jgi:hypothetical protein
MLSARNQIPARVTGINEGEAIANVELDAGGYAWWPRSPDQARAPRGGPSRPGGPGQPPPWRGGAGRAAGLLRRRPLQPRVPAALRVSAIAGADGSTGHELVGASSFPRHWIYDADGKQAGKSALIDFKTWYRTATPRRSPWRRHENAVLTAEAETPRERRLSQVIMRDGLGQKPKPAKVTAGTTIMAEGEAADNIVLVLDGMVQVEVGGTALAELGPGVILGAGIVRS